MSHLVTVDVQVKDPDAAKAAANFMGWEFHEGCKQFAMWEGEKVACEHKIVIPGCPYEIGLVRSEDGSHLVPSYDEFATNKDQTYLTPKNGMCGFLPAYQKEVVRRHLKRKGLRYRESIKDGKTRITVTA